MCIAVPRALKFSTVADNHSFPCLLLSSDLCSLNPKTSKWLGLLKSFVCVWFLFMFGFAVLACTDWFLLIEFSLRNGIDYVQVRERKATLYEPAEQELPYFKRLNLVRAWILELRTISR